MSRYYIPHSPSQERQRQMSRLMGLGEAPDLSLADQLRLASLLWSILPKLPSTIDVGRRVCDVVAFLNVLADTAETTGLKLPSGCGDLSGQISTLYELTSDASLTNAGDIAVRTARLAICIEKLIKMSDKIADKAGDACPLKKGAPSEPVPSTVPPLSEADIARLRERVKAVIKPKRKAFNFRDIRIVPNKKSLADELEEARAARMKKILVALAVAAGAGFWFWKRRKAA